MLTRIISAVVGIILLGYLINTGGWLYFLGISLLNVLAIFELNNAFKKINVNILYILSSIFAVMLLYTTSFSKYNFIFTPFSIILMIVTTFLYSIINNGQNHITDVVFTVFSFIYTSFLFMYFILLRKLPNGINLVWWVFITIWACDTGAFFIGIFFGKKRLAPNISPKKTIGGSLGGITFSIVASLIYTKLLLPQIGIAHAAILGLIIGILSQLGDLSASLIKRYCKIKDFSKIIPGHGGILDRLDSALFSFPVAYIYITIMFQKGGLL